MIKYASVPTQYGDLIAAESEKGLCFLGLPGTTDTDLLEWTVARAPEEQLLQVDPAELLSGRQLAEYFAGKRQRFDIPLDLRGSAFQVAVWRALTEVPFGQVCSYGELAWMAGYPRAARATGQAMNKNPVAIVVPCHRVIAGDGTLGGYGGGEALKKALLWLEGHSIDEETGHVR